MSKKKHKPIKLPKLKQRNPFAESAHARKAGAMHDKRDGLRAVQKELKEALKELYGSLEELQKKIDEE